MVESRGSRVKSQNSDPRLSTLDLHDKETSVASKSKIAKAKRTPKFSSRAENRCRLCGRPRAVYRKFGICRICFRKLADQGLIPGVRNASW